MSSRPAPFTRAAVVSVAVAALIAAAGAAKAAPEPTAPEAAADVRALERAFWYCDYLATTRGARATPVLACRSASEQLKRVKFGGSFERLLQWWRENKPEQHRRLATLEAR